MRSTGNWTYLTSLLTVAFAAWGLSSSASEIGAGEGDAPGAPPAAPAEAQEIGWSAAERLRNRVSVFVRSLSSEQRELAAYSFDDSERFDLRLAPLGLEGLRLDDLSAQQSEYLESAREAVLSPVGMKKLDTIRSLEREVAETENGIFGFFMDRIRDPRRYYLSVYGDPDESETWGLRFDGHHVSMNWTVSGAQELRPLPFFFGAQPRVVPSSLERAGLQVLEEEETGAISLLRALSEESLAAARIGFRTGSGIRRPMSITGGPVYEASRPLGVLRSDMNEGARRCLDELIDVYLGNFVDGVAQHNRHRIYAENEELRFIFASPSEGESLPKAGEPLYYRIEAGSVVVEYDNTSPAADHVHVVWRDAEQDFGRDLLGEHLSNHH